MSDSETAAAAAAAAETLTDATADATLALATGLATRAAGGEAGRATAATVASEEEASTRMVEFATSAPGLGSPLHICAGTGPTPTDPRLTAPGR
jgi:hypothetical protein